MSVGNRRLVTVATELKKVETASSSAEKGRFPTNKVSLSGLTESPNLLARSLARSLLLPELPSGRLSEKSNRNSRPSMVPPFN